MAAGGSSDPSLIKRIIVAVIFAPLIVWFFLYRSYPLFFFLLVLTAVCQMELYHIFNNKLNLYYRLIGHCAGIAIVADAFFTNSSYTYNIVVLTSMLYFLINILTGNDRRLEKITLSIFSTIYPAMFIIFLLKIDFLTHNIFGTFSQYFLVFILLMIWTFDTASYFVGRAFGKHRFFQKISPKKTVEGFIGGLTATITAGVVTGIFVNRSLLIHFFLISLLVGLSCQIGDLSESIIKRDMGTKDSSHIIPGHGGFLDRFDSLLFAGPSVYMYLLVFSL
ncbi:phosphatidate cytidylyltransferase [Candidatus Latescibacterota bacterium]